MASPFCPIRWCRSTAASPPGGRSSGRCPARRSRLPRRHDDDPFARYEAMQELVVSHLVGHGERFLWRCDRRRGEGDHRRVPRRSCRRRARRPDARRAADAPVRDLPAEQMLVADPGAIHAEREGLKAGSARRWRRARRAARSGPRAPSPRRSGRGRGARKVKTRRWSTSPQADPPRARRAGARNMTRPTT
jgi:aminopeptidase N